MSRIITSPPSNGIDADGSRVAGWWQDAEDGRGVLCDLCPRACVVPPGKRGFCFVRENRGGQLVSTTYGRSTGFCIDPIEKKPLNHFYPGTPVLSFGTAGCNLGCKFCQNWTSTKSRDVEAMCEAAAPEAIAEAARRLNCRSVAFTYNDPIVWTEYAVDTARACHAAGVKTVAVTSGYMRPAAREAFYEHMDAANVDLKGFSEDVYRTLCGGRLEPVLDTLRWLTRETKVWLEITNLIIPGENDSPDEIERMCRWIVEELGPDVPLHFSAFHPDFKLTNRPATPPETLIAAYDIARRAGLRYVYTGNVIDAHRQATYCPNCGEAVIERDGYLLGKCQILDGRCAKCQAVIAGRFDDAPGSWGGKRQPVRIAAIVPEPPSPKKLSENLPSPRPAARVPRRGAGGEGGGGDDGPTSTQPAPNRPHSSPLPEGEGTRSLASPTVSKTQPASSTARPMLTEDQERLVFQAAGQRVAATVRCSPPAQPVTAILADAAKTPVYGAFVSLKRAGQLRSCCGFLGQNVPLAEALDQAAVRAAKDDPRFPPISPVELEHLDMEVWLLWGLQPVTARGRDRVEAITIGKHGLQIARGHARGLLLPGVATDHHLDAKAFLQQVCLKAGLPPDAWLHDDTTLMTFEGHPIRGKLRDSGLLEEATWSGYGPSPAEVAGLAQFCRGNLETLLSGGTPSYYLPGVFDGGVYGLAIALTLPGGEQKVELSTTSLRSDMPLQSTLFNLAEAAANVLRSHRVRPDSLRSIPLGLTVLTDPALLGTAAKPELQGFDPRRRAVLVTCPTATAWVYDPERTAEELLQEATAAAELEDTAQGRVYSMGVVSTEPRAAVVQASRQRKGPEVRPAAVAGMFYPGTVHDINRDLDELFSKPVPPPEPWAAALVPHAGWVYSGRLAATVLRRIQVPEQVIMLCPKHRPGGAEWAVAPHARWAFPNGELASDPGLARRLADGIEGLELDAMAHAQEHAIEVQLPILARVAPAARVVGIAIGHGDLAALQRFGHELAVVLRELPSRPLLIVSSDMNHFADDMRTRSLDRMALDAIETMDPARLFETVQRNHISMCGMRPAVIVMEALRQLDALHRCEVVGYTTSAEASRDVTRVVGYAGVLMG